MRDIVHSVDRLKKRFGSINAVAKAAGVKQNTVSGWRKRAGVPLDAARNIVKNASAAGVNIKLTELFRWIDADAARREK